MTELNAIVPPTKPIKMCTVSGQQFLISRDQVRKRPLSVWKELQFVLSIQNVCHAGDPDYKNLFAFHASQKMKLGPEDPFLGMGQGANNRKAPGRVTQAGDNLL